MSLQLGGLHSRHLPFKCPSAKPPLHAVHPHPHSLPLPFLFLTQHRIRLRHSHTPHAAAADAFGTPNPSSSGSEPSSNPKDTPLPESSSASTASITSHASPPDTQSASTSSPATDPSPDADPILPSLDRMRNALMPLFSFCLTVIRWFQSFPAWVQAQHIKRLRDLADEDPLNADKHTALLMELNKVSPREVISRVQSRKFAADSNVAVEYLKALVATDLISEYASTSRSPSGKLPDDHRSLSQLLRDLQQQAEGAQGDETPGSSSRRPLHVTLGSMAPSTPVQSGGPLKFVYSLLWTVLMVAAISFAWLVGSNVVKRLTVQGGASVTSISSNPGSPSIDPKEYKKDEMPEKSVKMFKDVKGCDEAKAELQEVVEFLKDPQKFTRLGAKLPKGVLLTGPPGTGKTLLAKAVAGEAGVPFFYRSGSEFEELYVGVGARRMRALFGAAKKKAPCIVFIDEIDAIGGNRKQWDNHTRKTLNQLLVEMDGFEANEGVIVMAATNLVETLDPALKRPGRFDRQVAVPLPDVRGRLELLEYYLGDKPVDPDVDKDLVARQSAGFSGADLSNLVNEAALQAAKTGRDSLNRELLEYAFDKIRMGVERKSVRRSLESLKRTAYHEAGHALVALHTAGSKPIHKATIVPRGHALGMVTQVGSADEFSINKEQMLAEIRVCMGGKVAEELIFGKNQVTSGCTNDLKQATRWARHMVTECGLCDDIGPMYITDDKNGVSEDLRQQVDAEVRRMLVDAQDNVMTLLQDKLTELHAVANALLEHETLTATQIQQAIQGELPARVVPPSTASPQPESEPQPEPLLVGGESVANSAAAVLTGGGVDSSSSSSSSNSGGRNGSQ